MTRLGVGAAVGLPVKDGLGRGDKLTRAVWVYDDEALAYEVSLFEVSPVFVLACVACADDETLMETEALADEEVLADEEPLANMLAEEEGYAEEVSDV